MANHKSAIKRIRQNKKRRARNKKVRTRVRTATKAVEEAVANDADDVQEKLVEAVRTIDKAASKGVIPKRRASRKVSRLSRLVDQHQASA